MTVLSLKFGTWTHDGFKINLTEKETPVDISGYQVTYCFLLNLPLPRITASGSLLRPHLSAMRRWGPSAHMPFSQLLLLS